MSETPLLEVSSIVKTYRVAGVGPFARKNARPALAGVSFSMQQGRSFGVVGESGSGKSTLARIALALDRPDSGVVRLQGHSLFDLPRRELRAARAHMQMVFQDPFRGRRTGYGHRIRVGRQRREVEGRADSGHVHRVRIDRQPGAA